MEDRIYIIIILNKTIYICNSIFMLCPFNLLTQQAC